MTNKDVMELCEKDQVVLPEYVIHRLYELEDENENLKTSIDYYKTKLQVIEKMIASYYK